MLSKRSCQVVHLVVNRNIKREETKTIHERDPMELKLKEMCNKTMICRCI